LTVCFFRCTYFSVLFYIVSTGVTPSTARFYAQPLLFASASLTVPHHHCDRPKFSVHTLSYMVLLFLTAVAYSSSFSELPLSIESLNTQNCARLKGIKSAGPSPLRGVYMSRGQVWSCFGHFHSVLPCFANVCNSIEFPFLQPLNASRAHRVCKFFAVYYGLPK
jgi:hypothetical protein